MSSFLRTWRFIAEHPLGRRRRFDCLTRWARWQVATRLLPYPVICPFVNEATLVVESGMTGATGNVYVGLHEFADMAFTIHVLRPGDLFLDLGANVGTYTVLASAVAGARTLACEPIPATFARLERNLRVNGIENLAMPRCVAVGAEPGVLRFVADCDTTNRVAPESYHGKTVDVPVTTLDALLADGGGLAGAGDGDQPLVVAKADLEGHESAMLRGAAESLGRGIPDALLIESDAPDVGETLIRHDFRRSAYRAFERALSDETPESRRWNSLWVREKSLPLVRRRLQEATQFHVQGVAV